MKKEKAVALSMHESSSLVQNNKDFNNILIVDSDVFLDTKMRLTLFITCL
jgi:hypothetical protein